jgi:hypothetical protein
MRTGSLRVARPIETIAPTARGDQRPFLLWVEDDDGAFPVIGSRWVRERWAGAAPIEPSTADQLRGVERLMLREADRRRHEGSFDLDHPMTLEGEVSPDSR